LNGKLNFWFSIGSTYTYLTVMRIQIVAAAAGVAVTWRPFSVRALMIEQNNIPFRDKPIKTAYMWRDIERRAEMYGFPARVPAPYPLAHFDLANQVAIVAAGEGWCEPYVVEAYRRWFQGGQPPGAPEVLPETLRALGQDPDRVTGLATSPAGVERYQAAIDDARRLQLFGSPSFSVGDEIFWGDDRLDDALAWARRH
jgi:2-hydroxychromene-2-carboxylate isomerase